jgi:hypothetical protein
MQTLEILGIVVGLGLCGFGFVDTFAYMMSDDPMNAEAGSNRSCLIALAGLVMIVASVVGLVL